MDNNSLSRETVKFTFLTGFNFSKKEPRVGQSGKITPRQRNGYLTPTGLCSHGHVIGLYRYSDTGGPAGSDGKDGDMDLRFKGPGSAKP